MSGGQVPTETLPQFARTKSGENHVIHMYLEVKVDK